MTASITLTYAPPLEPAPLPPSRRPPVPASRHALALAGFIAATAVASVGGALFTPSARHPRTRFWYAGLRKARGNPPKVVFPIVWTALYAGIAASGWRVWRAAPSPERTRALAAWATQLGFNTAWTPLFFGARRPAAAMIDLVAMWASIAVYATHARRVDRPAAWLMAPYLAWTSYAAYLNAEILRLNSPARRRMLGGQ